MNKQFTPLRLLLFNKINTQNVILSEGWKHNHQELIQIVSINSLEEAKTALQRSTFDALLVVLPEITSGIKPKLQKFRVHSPYFPLILLVEKKPVNTPSFYKTFDFPILSMKPSQTQDEFSSDLYHLILQTQMQLREKKQIDQLTMLDHLEGAMYPSEEEMARASIDNCRKFSQSEAAYAILLDQDKQIFQYFVSGLDKVQAEVHLQHPLLQEIIQNAIERKQSILYPMQETDFAASPISRCLAFPVLENDNLHCVLVLINKITPYLEEDILYLKLATAKIWGNMRRSQSNEAMQQRIQELETINRISTTLRQANSLNSLLDSFLNEILSTMNTDVGALLLYNEQTKMLDTCSARGWINTIHDIQIHIDQGISGKVFRSGAPIITPEFKSHPDLHPDAIDRFTEGWGGVCYPILSSHKPIGVFFLSVKLPRVLNQHELQLLSTLTEIAGNTIQRMQLYADLEKANENLKWEDEQLINLMDTLNKDRELFSTTLMEIGEGVITLDEQNVSPSSIMKQS
jgi:hypothetical protein